jgi:hypothetical protein
MEIWRDFQTSDYYALDKNSGKQTVCNKFGDPPIYFKPYTTGFQNCRLKYDLSPDPCYRVQPKKFDGYFQCPRPASQNTKLIKPYIRDTKIYKLKRLPDDIDKIPKPVTSLGFSRAYKGINKSLMTKTKSIPVNSPKDSFNTIDDFKNNKETVPMRDIKTAENIYRKHKIEKQTINGYQPPANKVARRQLKGFFVVEYPTTSDLFIKEKKLLEITNPVALSKQRHMENTDLKNLEKRREQRILKNKLIQG